MNEKHEKWFVFALIALAIWYFVRKTMAAQAVPQGQAITSAISTSYQVPTQPEMAGPQGSIVNPTSELFNALPYQSSTPVLFKPAQPSTVPISQRVSVGAFDYAPPIVPRNTLRVAPTSGRYLN